MWKSPIITCLTILILIIPGLIGCENKTKTVENKTKFISKKIGQEVKQEPSQENDDRSANVAQKESGESENVSEDIDKSVNSDKEADSGELATADVDTKIAPDKIEISSVENSKDSDSANGDPSSKINLDNDETVEVLINRETDEEKRKAAELLASIHQEVSSINGDKKNGLDTLANPFRQLFNDDPISPPSIKNDDRPPREKTPITIVDLSQLKLVATMRAPSGNKALVEDSTGKGYVVDKGTPIGLNYGKIVEIKNDSVVVDEEIETLTGDIKIQRREIKLQKAPGE